MAAEPNSEKLIASIYLASSRKSSTSRLKTARSATRNSWPVSAVENDLIDDYVREQMPVANGAALSRAFWPRSHAEKESNSPAR